MHLWKPSYVKQLYLSNLALLCIVIGFFSGCATDVATLEHFSRIYYNHSIDKAHKFASKKAKSGDLLWLIQAGISGFHTQSTSTLPLLDQSEYKLQKFEQEGLLTSALTQVGATLVNDNVRDYRGNIYESIFVNYYKAIAYLANNDLASAQVELNRANDRQRRAKDYYAKQIAKVLEQEQDRYNKSNANSIIDQARSTGEIDDILSKHYGNLKHFSAFENFINPSVSYIAGLVFSLYGDSKGLDYLKEAYGITRLPTIASDMKHFLSHSKQAYTWIILEEGRQARKTELHISLPFYTTQGLYHFGLALPQLESIPSPKQSYMLDSLAKFEVLAEIDPIIATEFEKQLKAISTRALVSSSIKLAMQVGVSSTLDQVDPMLGLLGSMLGSIYSMATTSADLRITSVLPKRILLARIPHTQQQAIHITTNRAPIATLTFTQCDTKAQNTKVDSSLNAKKSTHKPPNTALCLGYNSILYVRDTPARAYVQTIYEQAP